LSHKYQQDRVKKGRRALVEKMTRNSLECRFKSLQMTPRSRGGKDIPWQEVARREKIKVVEVATEPFEKSDSSSG